MAQDLAIGVIGCGNISKTYFTYAPLFNGLRIIACADAKPAAAEARAKEFGIEALSPEALLADPRIDLVINLTVPAAHFAVSRAALAAGKHVYSEKPFVLTLAEGEELRRLAGENGLAVGSAPDTFLGGAHQRARAAIDAGEIGTIVAGTAHVMSHGMEHWHPNPDFFYQAGGGPILDVGPYYIANLINFLGPVNRVGALTSIGLPRRLITSQPLDGTEIIVGTPTNAHALLEFDNGATITLSTSWDVWAHRHGNMELYGTEGSLFLPDPNFFGGTVEIARRRATAEPLSSWDHPFGVPNEPHHGGMIANYRTAGLADMVQAILAGREARCGLDRALHAIEVMTAILTAGEEGQFRKMTTRCTRPAALGPEEAAALLRA